MKVIQTLLEKQTELGKMCLVTWLPVDPRVKPGTRITLKDTEGVWRVSKMYSTQEMDSIPRGWGLDLPKSQRTEG